jgi:predicted HD superfamily hydrolase involved in NAD metabolism
MIIDREKMLDYLGKHVSRKRLNHCLGVEETAIRLGLGFGVPEELLVPAALLHDLCREYEPDLLLKLADNFGIVIDDIEKAEPLLLHGTIAAVIVQRELGISAPEILEAIEYHITGRANASIVTKIIFISDFIEPGRAHQSAHRLRETAFNRDLDSLLLEVYDETIHFVVRYGYLIHPHSTAGRNELIMKGVKTN